VASEGPNSPASGTDDGTVGTKTWNNPGNITASDESDAAVNDTGVSNTGTDETIRLVLADSSLGVENKADTVTEWPGADAYVSHGGAADAWSETLTGADVNNSNFGVVISGDIGGTITHYLKAADFSFSIPETDIIDGIEVEIEKTKTFISKGAALTLYVDHVRITVTHSEAPAAEVAGQDGPYVY